MSIANVSQHLQQLRHARLVETEREGTKVRYRLAGDDILRLWLALRSVAESRLADVDQVVQAFAIAGVVEPPLSRDALADQIQRGEVVLIDVRPPLEYGHGHLPGALSLPLDELPARLGELPRDKTIVAYCRGPYCVLSYEAVAALRARGFKVRRLEDGFPEWRAAGLPVTVGNGS